MADGDEVWALMLVASLLLASVNPSAAIPYPNNRYDFFCRVWTSEDEHSNFSGSVDGVAETPLAEKDPDYRFYDRIFSLKAKINQKKGIFSNIEQVAAYEESEGVVGIYVKSSSGRYIIFMEFPNNGGKAFVFITDLGPESPKLGRGENTHPVPTGAGYCNFSYKVVSEQQHQVMPR